MQKKIFTSLLMSPLAFGALANVDLGDLKNVDWASSSVTGGELLDQTAAGVTGSIGVGAITYTVDVTCPGTYKVSFTTADNLKFGVVSGAELDEENTSENELYFYASAAGKVTVSVEAANAAASFSFVASKLVLVYDFVEAKAEMTA